MLRIRPEQLRILTEVMRRAFARKMADHLKSSFPAEVRRRFGDADAALAAFVEAAITEAAGLGIVTRDSVRRYLEDRFTSAGPGAVTGSAAHAGNSKASEDVAKTPAGEGRVDDPTERMPRQSLSCRFIETRVRCGDVAHVEVEAHGLPDGTPVSVEVRRITDGTLLAGLSKVLEGRVSCFQWQPTRASGMTAYDGFILQVSAAGLIAAGPDVLAFETSPPVGPELRTIDCREGPFVWTGRYRIAFDGEQVTIGTRIRVVDKRGTVSSNSILPFIKGEIEWFLSGRFGLVRDGCWLGTQCSCVKPIRIQVDFVERDEDHVVDLYTGSLYSNSAQSGFDRGSAAAWTETRSWRGQWAHSVGHLLGWLDDAQDPGALMGTGDPPRSRDLEEARDWLTARTGQPWLLVRLNGGQGDEAQ
jgi:hypothetical protein